jgi:hypothetical protein
LDRGASLTVYPKGLVSFYPLESAGTTLSDESKNGNNGRIVRGNRSKGIAGSGLKLKSDEYAVIDTDPEFNMGTHGFSIGIFFKPSNLSDGKLLHKKGGGSGYEIRLGGSKIRSSIIGNLGQSALESNTKLSSGKFYFITLVRDGGGFGKLYINGQKEAESVSEFDVDSPSDLIIGDPDGNGVEGVIDEIYIYKLGLQGNQIKNIYEKYIGP